MKQKREKTNKNRSGRRERKKYSSIEKGKKSRKITSRGEVLGAEKSEIKENGISRR